MINSKKEYKKYADELLKKGVSPQIICIGDIIRLLTEDDDIGDYNFNLNNIVSGPFGELIRVNKKKGTVEIYNCIMDGYFSLRVYNLDTGKMFEDGELGREYNEYDSIKLFGNDQYDQILDYIENDFSDCHREISKDKANVNIKMLELTNRLSKEKLVGLKERLLKVVKKYCKRDDYINEGIGRIIYDIDNAYNKHSEIKEFISEELDDETVSIINRELYLQGLREESDAYSKISVLPITEIIEEYQAYKTPKTDKLVKKYIFISRKINEVLSSYGNFRIDVREHLLNANDIDKFFEKHRRLLLKRRNELDNFNTWGLNE